MARNADNPFARERRELKVAALVTQIDADLAARGVEADALVVAAQVASYSASDWERIRRRAGIRAPSDDTIEQVRTRFRVRAEESIEGEPASGEYLAEEMFS